MKAVTFDVHSIAEIIKEAGHRVVEVIESDEPELADDEISLENDMHVQVGETYCMLVKCENFKYHFGMCHGDTDDLLKEIAEAMP